MTSIAQSAQFKAANPRSSVWVSASAGTGKTRVLVNRILRLLLDGNSPEKLLCITYTKSAAAEILERISQSTAEWATANDDDLQKSLTKILERAPHAYERQTARTLLPKILQAPGGMRIMTIHAFCQSVLSRFPLESGINGNFDICDEQKSHDLLNQAKQNLLMKTSPEANPELFDALAFLYDRVGEETQDNLINTVIKKRHKLYALQRHFPDFISYKKHFHTLLSLPEGANKESLDQAFLSQIPGLSLSSFADVLLACKTATPKKTGEQIKNYLIAPSIDAYCKIFLTQNDTILANLFSGIDKSETALLTFLETESERAFQYKKTLSALDLMLSSTSLYLCCLSLLEEYKTLKQNANLLDYEDQILLTERLLTELSDSQWVLYKLDAGIDHILLDEAQDTSPSQWTIIGTLVEEFFNSSDDVVRTIFVVGDEKQSIFSFQNADPASFALMKELLKEKARTKTHPYEDLSLIENYRSSPLVLDYVDLIFKDEKLKKSISHIDKPIEHTAFFKNYPGQIDIWPLVPIPENPIQKSEFILANQIAEQVSALLKDGTLTGDGTPLQPGHIMVLVRKRQPMVNPLVKAFKDRNIPVHSIDRLLMSEQLAVQDCLSALRVCLNPLDDYQFSCFLKTPFIGFSEEDLFTLANGRETSLWERLLRDGAYADIVAYYNRLVDASHSNIPYHFFHALLSLACPADPRSGKHALIRRLGYEAEDILDQFLDTILVYQQDNAFSNQGFITWLLRSDATTKAQSVSVDESHVRIMTVHASKGLQAPIVFLADAHSKPEGYKPTKDVLWRDDSSFFWGLKPGSSHPLFTQEKEAFLQDIFDEYHRLLYVALTRAKERLVICGCVQGRALYKEYRSWYDIASDALDQLPYQKHSFTLFNQEARSVQKAAIAASKESAILPLPDMYAIPNDLFQLPKPEPLPHFPLRPSQLPGKKQAVFSPLSENRAHYFVRGEILHKIFASVSRFKKEEQSAALNQILDHYTQDAKEKKALYDEAWSILANEKFATLFSDQSRAEVPITGQITLDGITYNVNGQIDRLLIEKDRVLIVDFKTNRPASMSEDAVSDNYKFQLKAYKMILEKIYPDRKIETAILWTSVPYLLPLSV